MVEKNSKPIITIGKFRGRFGNQIFQYGFIKTYAHIHGLSVHTPKWVGQFLFGHQDPEMDSKLPIVHQKQIKYPLKKSTTPLKNVEVKGFFQYHTSVYAPYKSYYQSLFTPVAQIERLMLNELKKLKKVGKTIIGIHLRRGDYVDLDKKGEDSRYYITPTSWPLKWLSEHWKNIKDPVLFIASDEIETVMNDFKVYKPFTTKDFLELKEAPFYTDFYLLSQCDILLISNSSFSFSASMLNNNAKLFLRPDYKSKKFVSFNPWNSDIKLSR